MMDDVIGDNVNSKSLVKLTWTEINHSELNKLEQLIDKIRATYLNMEARIHKNANPIASKPAIV